MWHWLKSNLDAVRSAVAGGRASCYQPSMSYSTLGLPAATRVPASPALLGRGWQTGIIAAAFLLLWAQIGNHLRMEWTVNPQYGYGWSVPLLVLFLLYKRWPDRPASGAPRWRFLTVGVAIAAALPLLPARIVSIANPDWRLLSWALVISGVIISFCALNLAGGIPWVRYFAFPVLFFLVATPWPAQFEQTVVLGLMRAVAALTVTSLNAIGTLAIQRGNVIELSTGLVGIADACTGVRSLQSTLMISLFLGEFYRMSVGRRVLLLVAGMAFAFVCNLVRTLILCLVASSAGGEAIDAWHDSAGLTILFVSLAGLWVLCLWLKKDETDQPAQRASAPATHRTSTIFKLATALALWIALIEVSAASWYAVRGADRSASSSWTVAWPVGEPGYRTVTVPEAAQELLRYNDGGGATWTGADRREWLMYYFRWLPGQTAALFVKVHRPDVCLPAGGMTLRSDAGLRVLSVHGIQLPYRAYRFEGNGRNLDVFYCYWDGRSSYKDDASALEEDWTATGRLRAAWNGQREIGARMLEVVVWDYENESEAHAVLLGQLEKLVARD
jgi:exosortase